MSPKEKTIYSLIENQTFKGERPLFKSSFLDINHCSFQKGESALKISHTITCNSCDFSSKYIFWHNMSLKIQKSIFHDGARASIWYSENILLDYCKVNAPKIFRDSKNITIQNSTLDTNETLWDCQDINIKNSSFKGDYLLLHSNNIFIEDFQLKGNYSFQHTNNIVIKNAKISSKDPFWNSNNVTIYDSIIEGEYLGWYSKNLKLINCTIIGTQPLCYAKDLILENCEMINTDLAFEHTSLDATITTTIESVKNPLKGMIKAKRIDQLILDDSTIDHENLTISTQEKGKINAL